MNKPETEILKKENIISCRKFVKTIYFSLIGKSSQYNDKNHYFIS